MSGGASGRGQEKVRQLRARLARLEQIEDALGEARAEFEHELRRAGDALQRAGGRSPDVESRIALLERNIALNRRDLAENEKQRRALAAELRKLQE